MLGKSQVKYVRQLEQKKHRLHEQAFVAEGPKVVGDLLESGFCALQLFATASWLRQSGALPQAHVTPVTDEELQKLSFLQHPQQVLGVFSLPKQPVSSAATGQGATPAVSLAAGDLVLALDGVQDPGNLGTIIRIADWFGISTIYCSPDTADAWSPKVVQATMGSIARVNIVYINIEQLIRSVPQLPVYGTLLDGDDIYRQPLTPGGIIVMGNEGRGLSPAVRRLVTHKLLIPAFRPGAESLNVAIATAITCSEFRRRCAEQ